MNVKKGYKQLVAEAENQIQGIDSSELKARLENLDESVVIIDLRDVREVKREGKIAGSLHIPTWYVGILGRPRQSLLPHRIR